MDLSGYSLGIMDKIKLTKKNYLGEGYLHRFKNNDTGEEIFEECTKEEYERLGKAGGSQFNPVKAGWTWIGSCGGTVKVDNADSVLKKNEYCELPNGTVALNVNKGIITLDKAEIINDEVDSLITKQPEKWR